MPGRATIAPGVVSNTLRRSADGEQHGIAAGVPKAVVDLLEAIEVDDENRERRAILLDFLDEAGEPLAQADAVHQAGEGIGLRGALGVGLAFDELASLLPAPPHEQRGKTREQQQ